MSPTEPSLNPYAPAPSVTIEPPTEALLSSVPPPTLSRTGLKWLVICSLSAIPSFFWGLAITNSQITGMVTGILVFVIGYTLLDYWTANLPIRAKSTIRRTLKIAYGTRIAISILFPIGGYLDLACGIVSVELTQSITGSNFNSSETMSFGVALLTTLVQGIVLNLVLGCFALTVHVLQLIVLAIRR